MTPRLYTVSQLAAELGVTARTLRFYEDKGLLGPQRAGTTRIYSHRDRARMILILRGKRLGFSLRDIKDYIELYDVDTTHTEQLRVLLAAVRACIARLEEQAGVLELTLRELREVEKQAALALEPRARARVAR